ncbi:hypothetical protein C9J12_08525 [Photobacterium frigidiphilum]|uniref:Uncharacterized protein n=1 Tax=Photobacterium frigidiphilum TaxID=264736 RepID=A0A2T3JKI3_9GAMM|nr:hypothetical protein [Photobacterium frigidiphilum]PSU49521.1 hypothetical protein C9J12_08525 [Photobacterium frigidiphilum]
MKLSAVILSLVLLPTTALASTTSCESDKYHQYVDASLSWYQSLVDLSIKQDESLKEVGDWFLAGRKHHFELNREAVDWYLENDKTKLDLTQSVESWLQLTQQDVKKLSTQQDELGRYAKKAFDDRQSTPHKKNYELRSAFADLLTHPVNIDKPLNAYNEEMTKIAAIECN